VSPIMVANTAGVPPRWSSASSTRAGSGFPL
jgi:hypothetical protein